MQRAVNPGPRCFSGRHLVLTIEEEATLRAEFGGGSLTLVSVADVAYEKLRPDDRPGSLEFLRA